MNKKVANAKLFSPIRYMGSKARMLDIIIENLETIVEDPSKILELEINFNVEDFADTIYENMEDIPENPHHPNCRCWIEEIELDDKYFEIATNRIQNVSNSKREG